MQTIKEMLEKDYLNFAYFKQVTVEIEQVFKEFIQEIPNQKYLRALHPFLNQTPLRYWDARILGSALSILRQNPDRSILAIIAWERSLDIGFQNLFLHDIVSDESSLSLQSPEDIVKLSTAYFPEYLRRAEQIYGNIVKVFWGILKKGNVDGKFDSKGAIALFRSKGVEEILSNGFSEVVRNALAHGEAEIKGFDIEFGLVKPEIYSVGGFLFLYDSLVRTANSLALAITIFWLTKKDLYSSYSFPICLIKVLAGGLISGPELHLLGAVTSSSPIIGKQLHVSVKTNLKSRTIHILQVLRTAHAFNLAGSKPFHRVLVQLDSGHEFHPLLGVDPNLLKTLIENDAPFDDLSKVMSAEMLLEDESKLKAKLRTWGIILQSGRKWLESEVVRVYQSLGFLATSGKYKIREVTNLTTKTLGKIRVRVVLREISDAKNRSLVNSIILEVVRKYQNRFFSPQKGFDKGIFWPLRPSHIIVDMFAQDGTLRWLANGGWKGGNLLASAEYCKNNKTPILIDNPEEKIGNVRFRYSIDQKKADNAARELSKLLFEIQRQSKPPRPLG